MSRLGQKSRRRQPDQLAEDEAKDSPRVEEQESQPGDFNPKSTFSAIYESSQTPRRSYTGRGPKNYKRSDERIREEVCEMLTRDQYVDAYNIDVDVVDGEVILRGTVPDRHMKYLAEDSVEKVFGVKDISNRLHVDRHEDLIRKHGRH
ncbi:hypothetical protein AZI85_00555 [Bdellovibrio bacteriovorus]|uniref:BON domain-containing protein n=1 Tax=Bdellovibrio bacteriovorus TaxID=959 RepID=A0A150WVJ0_BDEBC|nr:BON domain-containing protein [Bdellovibrio bacteriovorus]KYG70473.1 hypothetical protein AZI85_00555 [Bdellovibrio bacteriovorus]